MWLQTARLGRQKRIAQEARLAAEQANRSKSEFLAHMSHELRTPMNAVIGFTEIMTNEVFGPIGSPQYREYLADIPVSGQHLLQVVNNILDLAKVESGKWTMEEETIGLRELIDSSVQMVRERARSATIRLAADAAAPDLALRGDRRLMRQILINLVTNGIEFTEAGGRVGISWRRRDDLSLALSVADTGVGMTEEDMRRVLEPFGRGSAVLARAPRHRARPLDLPPIRRDAWWPDRDRLRPRPRDNDHPCGAGRARDRAPGERRRGRLTPEAGGDGFHFAVRRL
jgi:two-component system cell cycle sensor histidine kinase PleC